jgi:predicted transcriptional regulator
MTGANGRTSGASRRARGTLEREVLDALSQGAGLTPGEARDAVDPALAYTTVMTTLVRLHGKGLVDRERQGRSFVYTAVDDAAALSARAMRRALEGGPDHEAVLRQFVGDLSGEEIPVLQALLEQAVRADADDHR